MTQSIAHIALLVHDYDDAIAFYTQTLQFTLVQDSLLSASKRWVLVSPPGNRGSQILLAKAEGDQQSQAVGNQSGGRVFLFLYTDDFYRDYEAMVGRGIEFVRPVSVEAYGIVTVWKDLYGNLWDLIEPR